jgi:hypothetical protein
LDFSVAEQAVCARLSGKDLQRMLNARGILAMAEKHFAAAIAKRFAGMNRKERVAKIRNLAAASPEDEKFVRATFPDLYREAFATPRRAAGGRSESGPRRARSGARR